VIDRRELLATAANLGLLPNVVEKDYVLGWLLAGIFGQPALAGNWVFKGGTCLKKCYFETYRFSEDLDFTLTDSSHLDIDFLTATFRQVSASVYQQTGIEFPPDIAARLRRQPASCQGSSSTSRPTRYWFCRRSFARYPIPIPTHPMRQLRHGAIATKKSSLKNSEHLLRGRDPAISTTW
jgi:hypothetical protein